MAGINKMNIALYLELFFIIIFLCGKFSILFHKLRTITDRYILDLFKHIYIHIIIAKGHSLKK